MLADGAVISTITWTALPSSPGFATVIADPSGFCLALEPDDCAIAGEVSAIVLGLIVLAGPLATPQVAVAWIALVVGVQGHVESNEPGGFVIVPIGYSCTETRLSARPAT